MRESEFKSIPLVLIQTSTAQARPIHEMRADLNKIKRFIFSSNPESHQLLTKEFDSERQASAAELHKTLSGLQQLQLQFSPKVQ